MTTFSLVRLAITAKMFTWTQYSLWHASKTNVFSPHQNKALFMSTLSTCSFNLIRYHESVRWKKTHYFINSTLEINLRALLYIEICFKKTVKKTFICDWRALFSPHNWG